MSTGNPWTDFETCPKKETEGVIVDFGPYWLQVARAGNYNKKFAKVVKAKTEGKRRAIDTGHIEDDELRQVMADIYANSIITAWGSKAHGDGNMIWKDGSSKPFTPENVATFLFSLPATFQIVVETAGNYANYRAAGRELDLGN